jgi:hypothetical protein
MKTNNFSIYHIVETIADFFEYAVDQLDMDFKTLFRDFCQKYQMDLYLYTNSMYNTFINLPYKKILNNIYRNTIKYKDQIIKNKKSSVY